MNYNNPLYLFTRDFVKRIMKNRVYTAKRGLAKGLKRRGGLDFIYRKPNKEEAFLLSLDLEGQNVIDIGGYEGIFTLYFAHKVGPEGHVCTYEPNPGSCSIIEGNVSLNGFNHAEVRNAAVGSEAGEAELMFSGLDPAQGSLSDSVQANIERKMNVQRIKVKVVTIDDEVFENGVPAPDFVKIDTEGFEFDVLQGMKRTVTEHKPALYIENHGVNWDARMDNTLRLTEFLFEHGYKCYLVEHEEWMEGPERRNSHHMYCVPKDA